MPLDLQDLETSTSYNSQVEWDIHGMEVGIEGEIHLKSDHDCSSKKAQ